MTDFVLLHGGGGTATMWNPVSWELTKNGHNAIAMDLPDDDPSASWNDYVSTVVEAVGDASEDPVVVAHSASAFTGPLVSNRLNARLLILLAPILPAPGETFEAWWTNTHHEETGVDFSDEYAVFYHDVPSELAEADVRGGEGRGNFPSEPWPLDSWPDVPTRVLIGRDDHLLPPEFLRRVVEERLNITPEEVSGGHMMMLSRPEELAAKLVELST